MRNYLDSLTQVVAVTLAVDDCFVNASCGYTVVLCGANARKPLVVSQVEVGLETVLRHVALTVLVGVQCTWVDIDIRVEFLDGDLVAACL